ncbi:hypothetical protein GP486_004840 [Trichoglossum hirsutum]|uniref:Chromosome segregation ATPase family protein n=1 Tax=Trichoglossum hirsutum TaxID=265104 RepID=A0A9P8LA88_9PEZI|nr:hypothetical protein GP486_004840 [Trichoglossum hirsutum]
MPPSESESSRERELARERERERHARHQHSNSETFRASIPMWDSSDPERAPPPLPLNPSSPRITTGPSTSAVVAAAAAALTERARESAGPSAYTTNPMPTREVSPTKGLIKGPHHKRMQSLQSSSGNVRDISNSIDSKPRGDERTPERALEKYQARSTTPTTFYRDVGRELGERSPEKSPSRAGTPSHYARDIGRDASTVRQPLRPAKSILGENTPPTSATMLAIQNMPTPSVPDPPKAETVHSSALVRTPQTFDALSTQILSLTSIATNLQREMAQLSRRSKDNATDLISLKEATQARDEDIRLSLRELVRSLSQGIYSRGAEPSPRHVHDGSNGERGSFYLDSGPHTSPPGVGVQTKSVLLPRIPSPNTFAVSLEREYASSPHHIEGTASLAMLEKIIREMGTKEGQERLLRSLSELVDKMNKDGLETAKKLEEIVSFLKKGSRTQVTVHHSESAPGTGGGNGNGPPQLEFDSDASRSGPLAKTSKDVTTHGNPSGTSTANGGDGRKPFTSPRAADFVGEDILKVLRRLKDSVTENGGLTAEVKALVRELRGEVLGMGRELGRKLDEAGSARGQDSSNNVAAGKEELAKIVEEGLAELKDHMDRVFRENRRQSSSSSISRSTVDSQEIFEAVKSALSEMPLQRQADAPEANPGLEKEEILEAVREAWEAYKPEIELQNFGLEREEILQCLREGLEQYKPQQETRDVGGISREEVLEAVREALEHFTPPARIETEAGITREEILATVRECLETFEFPTSTAVTVREPEITRDNLLDAVKEGLGAFEFPVQPPASGRELDITRDDVLDAVKEGLEGIPTPSDKLSEQVLEKLQDIFEEMKTELRTASHETKQDVAASGRNTEQALDALKDGLEHLRVSIESYADKAVDTTGKDEILDAIRERLDHVKDDLGSSIVRSGDIISDKDEILYGMREGLSSLRSEIQRMIENTGSSAGTDEILDAINNGLDTLRGDIERSVDKPVDMTISYEILDTLKDGIAGLKVDIDQLLADRDRDGTIGRIEDKPIDMTVCYEILDTLKDGIAGIRADIDQLQADKDEGTKTDIGKAIDQPVDMTISYEILDTLKDGIASLRADIDRLHADRDTASVTDKSVDTTTTYEILDVLKDGLADLRADIGRLQAEKGMNAKAESEEALEDLKAGISGIKADLDALRAGSDRDAETRSGEAFDDLKAWISGIRADVDRLCADKERDTRTDSDEVFEDLKIGIAGLKADIGRLHEDKDRSAGSESGQLIVADSLKRNDIENLELLIAQLRVKVESLEVSEPQATSVPDPPSPPENALSRQDLSPLEDALKDVQEAITAIASREKQQDEDQVKREDVNAIETLLRNTKARIDEMELPDPDTVVKRDDLDVVEDLVRDTKEAFEHFAARMDAHGAKREDMTEMEALLKEVRAGLEEIREKVAFSTEGEDRVTKVDIETLGTLCAETNAKISELALPDPEQLPSKTDLEALGDIIHEYKAKVDTDTEATTKAIEDRKAENEGLGVNLEEMRGFLADLRDELRTKLEEGGQSVEDLGKTLEELEEAISSNTNSGNVEIRELMEIVTREFERFHGDIEDSKLGADEKATELIQKMEETRHALLAGLLEKLDERFDAIMAKYEDAQRTSEQKETDKDDVLSSTKAITEELKSLTEALATTVRDASEKIGDDSKTVFSRVDETYARIDEIHTEAKEEHHQTRQEIVKATTAVEDLGGTVMEYQPKILSTIKDVLLIVGQHYEQAQQQAMGKKSRASSTSSNVPPPPPPAMIRDIAEKYDDTEVQTKLDRLLNHATTSGKSFAQIELLDQIHQQVMATAAEVSEFVAVQAKLITEDHEGKERQAEEAAIALEKRLAQKEIVEAEVIGLKDESEMLREAVAALRAEKEELTTQKTRLAADVSGLETAVRLRREELATMESRAEALERRILEGIIDHSRALLISHPSRDERNMSLKRVPNGALPNRHSISQSGIGVALKARSPASRLNPSGASNSGRRILSLNQITGNAPASASGLSGTALPEKGITSLKRSQSVRTGHSAGVVGGYVRKSSWGGKGRFEGTLDKENEVFREEDDDSTEGSMTEEIDRRTSYGTTTMGTELTLAENPGAETGDEMDPDGGRMILYTGHGDDDDGDYEDEAESRRISSSTVNVTISSVDG